MWSVTLQAFGYMYMTYEYIMALLPAIFALENTGVHVSTMNSDNVTANVKASIDEHFCIQAILEISDINPDDYCI